MILNFLDDSKNFIDFGIIDAFDISELFFRSHNDARDGAETAIFKFCYVCSIDAILL